jgi:hypothetical protein
MAKQFDLNARRAARAEQEGKELKIGDDVFTLPNELPLLFLEEISAGKVRAALAQLVGGDRVEALLSHGVSQTDLTDVIGEFYSVDLGESPASTSS